jgi:SSS family solute:Na+ symporter
VLTVVYVGAMTQTAPADWWADAGSSGRLDFHWFNLDPQARNTVFWIAINSFAWMVCTHGGNQVALQRYFTMTRPREARRMLLIKMAAEIIMTVLLVSIGFALLSLYLRQQELFPGMSLGRKKDVDGLFPHFIASQLPPMLAGGVVAALFAAAMSTISSGINSMAAVFARDFYRPAGPQGASDPEQVRVGLWFTAVSGIAITAVAWGLTFLEEDTNFIDMMQKAFNFMLGPLGGLFLIGMFLPRCTGRSAVPATVLGLIVGLLLAYWKELFGTAISPFWVIAWPVTATFGSAAVFGLFEPRRPAGSPPPLTWRAVVMGKKDMVTPGY